MAVPHIERLQRENWQRLSASERLGALQELEDSLATQERREPCTLDFTNNCEDLSAADQLNTRGLHHSKHIYINDALIDPDRSYNMNYGDGEPVNPNEPYMATETLFHEAEHDYQEHVVAQPKLAEDPQQAQEWQMNTRGGYLEPEKFGFENYRWQPIEKDANEVARQRTDELYAGQFGDSTGYSEHRAHMADELTNDQDYAEEKLGRDYAAKARENMIEQYQNHHSEQQEASISPAQEDSQAVDATQKQADAPTEATTQAQQATKSKDVEQESETGKATAPDHGVKQELESGKAAAPDGETAAKSSEQSSSSPSAPAKSAEAPAETPSAQPEEDYSYGYGY